MPAVRNSGTLPAVLCILKRPSHSVLGSRRVLLTRRNARGWRPLGARRSTLAAAARPRPAAADAEGQVARLSARVAARRARRAASCWRRSSRRKRCGPRGVTYMRSREAREAESVGQGRLRARLRGRPARAVLQGDRLARGRARQPIRVRDDSAWNVPEPELTLVVNAGGEIVGYCVGNDMTSRDIEGENPLYLPQAKVYDGSARSGPGIRCRARPTPGGPADPARRSRAAGAIVFEGATRTSQIKRPLEELVELPGPRARLPARRRS